MPDIEQPPQAIDGEGEQAHDDHDLQVEAVEKVLHLRDGEEQGVLADILPGDEVDHTNGLTGQLELHRADDVALMDGGGGIIGQMEVFLGDGAVAGRGQQGHHVVVGVKLQRVGVG